MQFNSICSSCVRLTKPFSSSIQRLPRTPFSKSFSTITSRSIIAAPPIDFTSQGDYTPTIDSDPDDSLSDEDKALLKGLSDISDDESDTSSGGLNARIVPASPSYFTGKPQFTDSLLTLQTLLRKYQLLPALAPVQAPRAAWHTLSQYRVMLGEQVSAAKFQNIKEILKRLNRIHPGLMPEEVSEVLETYRRDVNPFAVRRRIQMVDEDGKSFGLGRRKASTAKVYLVEGEGEVLVNGKSLNVAFPRIHDRESAIWALKCTGRVGRYNVWAVTQGGGLTGQAESITLAVAKALMVHEPDLKPALRRAGCVTRDPRRVERKKPGHLKARKMPTWVKR
ncbi:37S ribosomal protein S9, mitochondrial [Ptychographa xylographoides]|nr:37S ribosomal protein S9, mitochondrial [Ptychographa xylographoides]